MRARLSSRRFIGRTGELAELELAAGDAACGRPTLVLLGGDSGVGKTRLITELERRLLTANREPPPLILRGDAVQASDGELPYAALLGALRPLVRSHDPVFDALHPATRAELATLLPGLEDPAARPATVATGSAAPGGSAGRLRLFEAVLALVERLGERTPVMLILEDVHWADRSTLAFLPFLVRSLRAERVMVLLSYRTDELHRRHPLRPLLGELERSERARRIELEPFNREELSEALADILGSAPEPALLERLFARSEGNALYTEELLAAGLDGRGAPPRSLNDAFLVRIERLSADAQRVARALALGRRLDEPALAALTGLEGEPLRAALREAVAEQVLIAGEGGAFGFRHALLREALYDDLLPGERGALHTALAHFLEAEAELGADDEERLQRALSIAFHHLAAGDQPAALRASVAAADAASCGQAHEEAADLYERALGLWTRVADPEALVEIDHVELLSRAAMSLSIVDERPRADALLREALGQLDPEREPARYALVLGRRGRVLWSLNRGAEAVAAGERALSLIPDDDPGRDRAWIRGWLARLQFLRGRYREAEAEAEAALSAARELGDGLAETELLNTRGMVKVALGQTEEGLASLRESIALATRREDPDSRATAETNLADMLLRAGRVSEGLAVVRAALGTTPRDHIRSRDWVALTYSEMCLHIGDWEEAERALPSSPQRTTGTVLIFRELREAELAAGIGDEERAARCLDVIAELVAASSESQWIGLYGALRGEVHARRGELEAAQAVVAQALDRMEVCTDDIARVALVSLVGLRVEADRAQRARDLGDTPARRDAIARAGIHLARIEAAAQDGGPLEQARFLMARAEATRARGRPSAAAWKHAAEEWSILQHPYPVAIARWREAEDLAARGDREGACMAARAALAGARELGSRWLEREIRGLGDRARLALDDAPPPPSPTAAPATADPFGLTDRERQVLSLLAEGATNRQIGATLYMAEKTASVHVSRILAKLDVRSRTEAAAVAHRLGLAAPPGTATAGHR